MTGTDHDFPTGVKAIASDSTQDWAFVRLSDGKLIARPEGEYTWRDEEEGIQLYVLISPSGRGTKLDTLNRSGMVVVEIKERFLRLTVTDVMHKVTYRYQWLNLWGRVIPEKSKFHLSQDNKRIVIWLQKKFSNQEAGSWGDILDVRKGKYNRSATGWPGVLLEVQGPWRSEDEEPIEVIGDQVVWPEGSRDLLIVDEETEVIRLVQTGDGDQVPREEFQGIYERHAHRLKWEDGDFWTRIPGLAIKRQDAGKDLLSLEYDTTLARWVPWLPPDELRRQITHWMPPSNPEIALQVALADGEGADVKRELLESVEEEGAEMAIADFDYLPMQLLLKCRVCALAAQELEGPGFIQTMLALRDHRRVSLANEAAALGALERWLQWLRPWLAPGSRHNVDGALEALKERLFEVMKDDRRLSPSPQAAGRDKLGCSYDRWPPVWRCVPAKPNDVLRAATEDLEARLKAAQAKAGEAADPRLAFGEARRSIGEHLFEAHSIEATSRRCDPLERRWARRYGQDASKSLLDVKAAKHLRRELRELGLAIVEDALDWGTLVKIHSEVERLFPEEGGEELQLRVAWARGGHARWAQVWTSKLEELGMTGLAAATAFLHQLAFRLSEWEFGKCRWRAVEDPVLWYDDGEPLQIGKQKAIDWAAPAGEEGGDPLSQEVEDEAGTEVPPERRVTAFLFLNTPAWVPEWGGALRCHLPQVHRDVWGDGGRLVLLREVQRYELLPSHHSHAVLMLRLRGTTISAPPPVPDLPEDLRTPEEVEDAIGPEAEHDYIIKKRAEQAAYVPESYHRSLTGAELNALAESVGARPPEGTEAQEAEGGPGLGGTAAGGGDEQLSAPVVAEVVASAESAEGSAGRSEARGGAEDPSSGEVDTGQPAAPKQQEKPPKLELDSHQVIKLFETSFSAAFKLD